MHLNLQHTVHTNDNIHKNRDTWVSEIEISKMGPAKSWKTDGL